MNRLSYIFLLCFVAMESMAMTWFDGTHAVRYSVVGKVSPVVHEALRLFSSDMEQVTGQEAEAHKSSKIEIYQLDLAPGKAFKTLDKLNVLSLKLMDNKDAFFLGVRNGKIIIVGNNGRGTAYGIMELSRLAGVSPWVWWGDVTPEKRQHLTIDDKFETVQAPSVEYRGIFINDEDWSLLQWAQTVDGYNGHTEEVNGHKQKAIGPKTYERLFQLMLRLRANMLWPAMHEVTKAFFNVHGNREMAERYGIVLGSSHCEPILRNNVGEWDKKELGDYNFITNRHNVENYWKERLIQMKGRDAFFTIGMRGIHDGSMEGVKTAKEKFDGLQSVIDSQRELIRHNYSKDVENVPQVFIPYKEVLEIYEQGLKVPEDVTLMWCDDNYGYMTRLSDKQQQQRKGGAGVYYHLSYWGRPHSYLWLTTTSPGLVYNELKEAYDHNARKLWIINVHDPKVAAYDLSLAMDMAWNINSVTPATIRQHLRGWLCQQFGETVGSKLAPQMEKFYKLTAIRRPEFMGWTQIELDKKKYPGGRSLPMGTEFSETEFGDELQRYLDSYDELVKQVNGITPKPEHRDAFFAHVLYPVECAAAMAHKQLEAQLGDTLSAMEAQEKIKALTTKYNALAGGKWKGLMDCKPQNLPVFMDYKSSDSTFIRKTMARPLSAKALEGCIVRNASTYDSSTGTPQPVEMLGHSQKAVRIPKGASLTFRFDTSKALATPKGNPSKAYIRTALIPTQANDKGDIRYSVSIDGGEPVVYSLKEPYRSERWKLNVLRGQALRTTEVELSEGQHSITITALDDHIILDQWMLDYKKDRKFYVFPNLKNNFNIRHKL